MFPILNMTITMDEYSFSYLIKLYSVFIDVMLSSNMAVGLSRLTWISRQSHGSRTYAIIMRLNHEWRILWRNHYGQ